MTISKRDYGIVAVIYPLFILVNYLQARDIIPPGNPGEGIVIWPMRLFMLYVGIKGLLLNKSRCQLFSLYVVYSFLSVVLYLFNGFPIHLYINDLAFFILPMLFTYVGMDGGCIDDRFYKYTTWAIFASFVVGFYLYFFQPSWYQDAIVRNYNGRWYKEGINASFDDIVDRLRFSSFYLTSYAIEYFGIFAFVISVCLIYKSNEWKIKWVNIMMALVIFAGVILSLQRAAIATCILSLIIFILYDWRHEGRLRWLFIFVAVAFVVFLVYFIQSDVGLKVVERFSEFTVEDTFSDARTSQNVDLLNSWNNIILGDGLGTGGNEARKMGFPAVTDSQYVKILCEQGLVGFSIFLLFLLSSAVRVLKYFRYLAMEGAILACVMVAMIGSNSLMFDFIGPIWFAIGRIWNKEYLKNKIINKQYCI